MKNKNEKKKCAIFRVAFAPKQHGNACFAGELGDGNCLFRVLSYAVTGRQI